MNKFLKRAFCEGYKNNSFTSNRIMRDREPLKSGRFALLLSGCGFEDGTEVTEAVTCIVGLSRRQSTVECFSIDRDQLDVVNHKDGRRTIEKRNMFVESARIAKGNLKHVKDLNAKDFDGLVIPGGMGVAKNFSTFAKDGANMKIDEDIERVIRDFYNNRRLIGATSIAPILLARIFGTKFGGPGCFITLGKEGSNWPYADAIHIAEDFGNTLERKDSDYKCIDYDNGIVTVPGYMNVDASPTQVDRGVNEMIFAMLKNL